MNRFDNIPEFEKEFKRLFKKHKTLDDDFEKFKKILLVIPTGIGKNFTIIHSTPAFKLVKARGDKENEDRERIRKYLTNYEI